MKEITIVGTVHNTLGQANVEQLVKVLMAIDPEVIFEEMNPESFKMLYSANPNKHHLEMRAIMKFKESRAIKQIPVDDFAIPSQFQTLSQFEHATTSLFSYIENASVDYRELEILKNEETYSYGFDYLSSEYFEKIEQKICSMRKKIVNDTDKEDIKNIFNEWNRRTQSREDSMIKNIYEKSRQLDFTRAAFLVGAGHIVGIKERIKEMAKTESNLINWKIWKRE